MTRHSIVWGALAAVVAVWVMIISVSHVHGEEKKATGASEEEDIDPIAVASVLIQDKHFERARALLSEVKPKSIKAEDRARFHLLFGLTLLELKEFEGAKNQLKQSIKSGQKDKVVYLFLAQSLFAMEDFRGAVGAMEKSGKAQEKLPGAFLLHAQSLWRTDNRGKAYDVLTKGIKAFPEDEALIKNRILLLVDLGLFQEAIVEGNKYLKNQRSDSKEHIALSQAFIKGKRYMEAIVLLESARLQHPDESGLAIQLARAYMEKGHPFIAARLFEHASRTDEKLTLDAAELYRRAGRLGAAERLNAKVLDQKEKIRQRLGLLIELHRFEEASALGPRLQRLGLLSEDAVAYGLAYAYFMTGRFKDAEEQLKRISDVTLFEKAIQLRRVMGTCSASGWQCP